MALIAIFGSTQAAVIDSFQDDIPAAAQTNIVTALFTGFLSPVPGSGMEALNTTLTDRFASYYPALTYSGRAFQWRQQQDALDYINSFDEIDSLFLVGHSFGGSSVIQLAENFLAPNNIIVDLTFQIDSVDNFLGAPPDNVLPTNVAAGYNYYQVSNWLFEPQGETFVLDATNINVETLFSDSTITHFSIDNDPRLHDQIFSNMLQTAVPEPSSLVFIATTFLSLQYVSRQRHRHSS